MNLSRSIAPAFLCLAAALLGGCATFSKSELDQMRSRQVSSNVMTKMESKRVLTPPDVIELSRRGVPERLILRQIHETGVDYLLNQEDVAQMRAAGVGRTLIDAVAVESERYVRGYSTGSYYGPNGLTPYEDGFYGPQPYRYGAPAGTTDEHRNR
jgi:hypothetical protein